MNRKERKARGIKGKKGDYAVLKQAIILARQLLENKKHAEAIKLYNQILEYDPDNTIALLDVGIDAYSSKKIAKAEHIFEKILRLDHKDIGALIMLATIRMDQNRVEEALDLAKKAERLKIPRKMLARMGVIYRDAGQLEPARRFISDALENDPEDISALYTLQTLRKFTPEEHDRMEKISLRKDIGLEDKMRIEFALGKACIDNGQPEKGFWHFAEGNLLKRATFKFSIEWIEEYFEMIPRLFNEEFIGKFRGMIKNKGGNQIFIVGMPRSGSTLVDQILSSHPLVTSVGEAGFLVSSMPAYLDAKVQSYSRAPAAAVTEKFVAQCSQKMLEEIGDKYLEKIAPFTKKQKIVVDKMLFNFVWLGIIRLALPDAKILHTMRDPIDMGLSIWQILFSDDIPWAYDQTDIGRYYLAYTRLMDHWRKVFPGEFLDVRYEDMVADQEGQSRRVIAFCGLPWDDVCLRFYENKRQVKTASVTQVRQPIYKDSVKKWKKYEKHLKHLVETVENGAAQKAGEQHPAPVPA